MLRFPDVLIYNAIYYKAKREIDIRSAIGLR